MATQSLHISTLKLSACESLLSYSYTIPLLLLSALNNTSLPLIYNAEIHILQRNDALAVLGDTRMDAVLCRWWWDADAQRVKGQWSQARNDLCGNAALVGLGRRLGVDVCVCVIKNPGTVVVLDMMVATAVEALMGVVYLDGGEEALEGFMKTLGFGEHQFL